MGRGAPKRSKPCTLAACEAQKPIASSGLYHEALLGEEMPYRAKRPTPARNKHAAPHL